MGGDAFHDAPSLSEIFDDPSSVAIGAWISGGICLLITLTFFAVWLTRHLRAETAEDMRPRRIHSIMIVVFAPVFALTSYSTLYFCRAIVAVDGLRSIYEAVVVYFFMKILVGYFGSPDNVEKALEAEPPRQIYAVPPFRRCGKCCCKGESKFESRHVRQVRYAALQLVIIRPICVFLSVLLWSYDLYDPGGFDVTNSATYIRVVNLISVMVAVYFLVVFYMASKHLLENFRPVFKFALIKLGLVLSVLQPMVFSVLVQRDVISDDPPYSAELRAALYSNWLLLLEMPFFAYLAWRAFPVEDYVHGFVMPLGSQVEEGRAGPRGSADSNDSQMKLPEHRRSLIMDEEKPPVAMEMNARPSVV